MEHLGIVKKAAVLRPYNKENKMSTNKTQNTADEAALKKIIEALKGLRFGSIAITVHNSKIVQIDRVEKTRFDRDIAGDGEGI
jgi:hypothetical protein